MPGLPARACAQLAPTRPYGTPILSICSRTLSYNGGTVPSVVDIGHFPAPGDFTRNAESLHVRHTSAN